MVRFGSSRAQLILGPWRDETLSISSIPKCKKLMQTLNPELDGTNWQVPLSVKVCCVLTSPQVPTDVLKSPKSSPVLTITLRQVCCVLTSPQVPTVVLKSPKSSPVLTVTLRQVCCVLTSPQVPTDVLKSPKSSPVLTVTLRQVCCVLTSPQVPIDVLKSPKSSPVLTVTLRQVCLSPKLESHSTTCLELEDSRNFAMQRLADF